MLHLKMSPEKAISLINERIDDIKTIRASQNGLKYYDFIGWLSKTQSVIDEIYHGDDIHPEEIRIIGLPTCSCNPDRQALELVGVYHTRLQEYVHELEDV
jgi:hypothetical protein